MLGFQNMAVEDNIVIRVVVGRFSNRFLVPVPITDSLYIGSGTFAMQKCVAVIEFAYTIQISDQASFIIVVSSATICISPAVAQKSLVLHRLAHTFGRQGCDRNQPCVITFVTVSSISMIV